MTLNSGQVPPTAVVGHDNRDGNDRTNAVADMCRTFFTGEGCAIDGSYIDEFVARFWTDLLPETDAIAEAADRGDWTSADRLQEEFWGRHGDRFVSDYASTNPGEDLAETFAAWVLADGVDHSPAVVEKTRFFDQFPELVELKARIRAAR